MQQLLTAVLVRLVYGRSGSTAMMSLLATSPEVAVEPDYPFEQRYLHRFVTHLDALTSDAAVRPRPKGWRERLAYRLARPSPPPATGLDFTPTLIDSGRFRDGLLCDYWARFSEEVAARRPGARFYAEKCSPRQIPDLRRLDGVVPVSVVRLVRDPRDAWASIQSFDRKRGFYGFGRGERQSRAEFLEQWIEGALWAHAQLADEGGFVARYEDMVEGLAGFAGRLGEWLDVDLDPTAVGQFREHMTTRPGRSVGRWRTDIPREESDRIAERLAPLMSAYGYG